MLSNRSSAKIVIIGPTESGKSELAKRLFGKGAYDPLHFPTISAAYYTIQSSETRVGIWDTAGLAKYQSITKIYIQGATALLFTISSRDFENQLAQLKTMKDKFATVPGFDDMWKILVFTQSDENSLSSDEIARAKAELNIDETICCSAKAGANIQSLKDRIFAIGKAFDKKHAAKFENFDIAPTSTPMPSGFFDRQIKPNGFWANHRTAFKVLSFATLGIFFGLYKASTCFERDVPTVSMAAPGSTTSKSSMRGILGSGDHSQADKRSEKTLSAAGSLQTMQYAFEPPQSQPQNNSCFRSNRK